MASKAQRRKRNQTRKPPEVVAFLADVEIVAGGEDSAPTFSVNAYNGGALSVNAYPLPIAVDLAGMTLANSVLANLDHDQALRVGHVTSHQNDGRSLTLDGVVSAESSAANEVVASAKKGYPWQASIEARPTKPVEEVKAGQSVTVNGQTVEGPAYVARQSILHGFAFLSRGADDSTTVAIAAQQKEVRTMKTELHDYIVAAGFDPDDLEDSQVMFFEAQMAGADPPKPKPKNLDDTIEAAKVEKQRQQKIAELAAEAIDAGGDIEAIDKVARLAIDTKQDVKEFELQMLRAGRVQGGLMRKPRERRIPDNVIQASLCLQAQLDEPEKYFSEETLEASHKAYPNGISLEEMFVMAAKQRGYRGTSHKFSREILEYAFQKQGGQDIHAQGWSYADIGGILSNVANKFLTNGFNSVERSYPSVSARRAATDFKTMSTYALTGNQTYEKVGDGGDIPHGTLGELPYTNRVETYGKMLAITRQTIVNDDMNALGQIPFRLGRGAALSLNRVFWTEFMNNATFWTAGNGTRLTGAGSALDEDGLNAAETAFDALKDPDGEFVGSMAEILLVPPALYNQALRLMNSSLVVGGTERPDSNVFQGRYTVVKSRYLEDSGITGNSATAWYLLANPADMAAIEIAYLNGRDTPTVESADADFNTLGVQMRGFHDFGVAKQEYRAGIANDGA